MARLRNFLKKGRLEAGCDEAGRGCLAGPVFAAAVILPSPYRASGLNDSKQLSEKERQALRQEIEQKALAWAVAQVDHQEIDQINILQASFLAMHRAINNLHKSPEHLLIDGNRFKAFPQIPHTCVVKGDGKFKSIAAASILAKTYRDDYMRQLAQAFPQYGWERNMGYPTAEHRKALAEHGHSPFHRLSFKIKDRQIKLNLEGEDSIALPRSF